MGRDDETRQRVTVTTTLDKDLIDAVDDFVREHPETNRDAVIDQALQLWYAREQATATRAQFADDADVDPEEWRTWRAIRRAAAAKRLTRRGK